MRRKTQEEKRETNRKKQARWRARHRKEWLYRQRKLATYGKATWQKGPQGVTDNPKVTQVEYVPTDESGQEVVVTEGGKLITEEEVRVAGQLAKLVARRRVTANPVRDHPADGDKQPGVEVEGF